MWWAFWDIISNSIKERFSVHFSSRVLEFSGGVPWKEYLFGLEKENNLTRDSSILYVIFTDQSGMWRILCVPAKPKNFDTRLPCPRTGRWVRDSELEKVLRSNKIRESLYKLVVSCLIFYLSQESWRWRRRL